MFAQRARHFGSIVWLAAVAACFSGLAEAGPHRCRSCYVVSHSCCEALKQCRAEVTRLKQCVAELRKDVSCLKEQNAELGQALAATQEERDGWKQRYHDSQQALRATQRKLAKVCEQLKCCREGGAKLAAENERLQTELAECVRAREAAEREAEGLRQEVAKLGATLAALERELKDAEAAARRLWLAIWALALLLFLLLVLGIVLLVYFRAQVWRLWHANRDAERQHTQDVSLITDLTGKWNASQADATAKAALIHDLERDKLQLSCCLSECKAAKAFAEQRAAVAEEKALGAVREMAANKKDCCCCGCKGSGPVIAPTVTIPNGPVTTTTPNGATNIPTNAPTTPSNNPQSSTCPPAAPAVANNGGQAPIADTIAQMGPTPSSSAQSPIGSPGNLAPTAPAPNATPTSGLNNSTAAATDSEADAQSDSDAHAMSF